MDPVCFSDRKRLLWIGIFQVFLFCALIAQFYNIQILQGDKWTKKGQAQHRKAIEEPFKRGSFFSNTSLRKGHREYLQPLVIDVPKFHLYIDPKSIPDSVKPQIMDEIDKLITLKAKEKKRLRYNFYKKSRSRKIASFIDGEEKNKIKFFWKAFAKEHKIAKNALFFFQDYKRSYPFGSLFGQALHTVRDEKDPITKQSIPTGGLEKHFDSYLKGSLGKRVVERSVKNSLDEGLIVIKPEDGADIHLTIDHYLQAIVEDELKKGIEASGAKGGWAVMMDPHTGFIYALADYPFFKPSEYKSYFNDMEKKQLTKARAVTDSFEPGSIFKPIILALALQASCELNEQGQMPLFYPEEKIDTHNGVFAKGYRLKDRTIHPYLNMYMAMKISGNIYMGKIVERMIEKKGDLWLKNNLENLFGFGKKTGIELPAESKGQVPTPGKLHPNGRLEWSELTPYALSIGHNVLVNSVQILCAFGSIANGGYRVKPTLVRKITKKMDQEVEILLDNTDKKRDNQRIRILDPYVVDEIKKGLKYVTKGGSGKRADVFGYTEAGKSGTSEKIVNGRYSNKKYISSFVGFAPADDPSFVLIVSVDEPEPVYRVGVGKNYLGGVCAAPIFGKMAKRALEYLGVAPDDPYGYPYGDPRRDLSKADWADEVEKLNKLYNEWHEIKKNP